VPTCQCSEHVARRDDLIDHLATLAGPIRPLPPSHLEYARGEGRRAIGGHQGDIHELCRTMANARVTLSLNFTHHQPSAPAE